MFGSSRPTLWTIGHSTRSLDGFLGLLKEHRIELLVDVRRFPTSERAPWTDRAALAARLAESGIAYEHLVDLGGYREPQPDSANTGWRQAGFRGYADHMDTDAFRASLARLLATASGRRTAVMCAEAVPWRCHRGLLSDAVLLRGARVLHVLAPGKVQEHKLTPFAKVHGDRVTYPAARGNMYMRGRG